MQAAPAWDVGEDEYDEAPRISFSAVEVLHLLVSVVVLSMVFALVGGAQVGHAVDWDILLKLLPYAAAAVVPAFILHELAHKVVAQRMDMWAEFRANFVGLLGGLALTYGTQIPAAIPGAVQIYGHADRRDEGIISIVGPLVNLAIGFLALFLDAVLPPVPIREANIGSFFAAVLLFNLGLAIFNMLPLGPLDGRKVWRWSKVAFVGVWGLIVALGLLFARPHLVAW